MNKLFKNMSKPFLLGTALAMGIGTVVYANSLNVSSGDSLTSSLWNSLISRVSTIESRFTALENNQGGGGDPGDSWSCGDNLTVGSFTYSTKGMPDGKCWTTTNMKHTSTNGNSRCYDNDSSNCSTYGRLYDWDAAMMVCEQLGDGWSLPSDAQWKALETSLGCNDASEVGGRCAGLGGNGSKLGGVVGFLPGLRNANGSFHHLGIISGWWSSTESGSRAWARGLGSSGVFVSRSKDSMDRGFSVVCVR